MNPQHLPHQLKHVLGQVGRSTPMWPLAVVVRWVWLLYRELGRDRAFVRAAGMSYATLVALVPMLVLVYGFVRATGFGGTHTEDAFVLFFDQLFGEVPAVREIIIPGLLGVDFAALGVVSVVGLVVVAARLYLMVEAAYCELFAVPIQRSLAYRLLNFYFTLTAVPVVLVLLMRGTFDMGIGGTGTREIIGLVLQMGMLVAALKLLPSTQVRWGPAIAGAGVSFVALELGRRAFGLYLRWFAVDDPMRAVYGSLGLIPLFLLWLYLLWVFVLLGVEVAYVAQNFQSLMEAELELLRESRFTAPSIHLALQVALWIAWSYQRGDGGIRRAQLAERVGVDAAHVDKVVEVLEDAGLVQRGAEDLWFPARPTADIALTEVVDAWNETRVHDSASPVAQAIDARLELEGSLADGVARWLPKVAPAPAQKWTMSPAVVVSAPGSEGSSSSRLR